MVNILKLKAKLKEKNLTQEELALKMGKHPSTMNKKLNDESGKYLTIGEVSEIKEILDISSSEVNSIFFV
ncbi:helix-turn-helix domain-containing protein [Fusobacterium necrophorum]|uniref:helix-turn-helix domain-containing protein n=1 Tax=Fusobacterium necrophorum TaxID=859 RepID=UPI00370EE953